LPFVKLVTSNRANLLGRRRGRLVSRWCFPAEPTLRIGFEVVRVGFLDYVLADPGILLLVGEFAAWGTLAVDETGRGREGFRQGDGVMVKGGVVVGFAGRPGIVEGFAVVLELPLLDGYVFVTLLLFGNAGGRCFSLLGGDVDAAFEVDLVLWKIVVYRRWVVRGIVRHFCCKGESVRMRVLVVRYGELMRLRSGG
jgi:hypothetical protein